MLNWANKKPTSNNSNNSNGSSYGLSQTTNSMPNNETVMPRTDVHVKSFDFGNSTVGATNTVE